MCIRDRTAVTRTFRDGKAWGKILKSNQLEAYLHSVKCMTDPGILSSRKRCVDMPSGNRCNIPPQVLPRPLDKCELHMMALRGEPIPRSMMPPAPVTIAKFGAVPWAVDTPNSMSSTPIGTGTPESLLSRWLHPSTPFEWLFGAVLCIVSCPYQYYEDLALVINKINERFASAWEASVVALGLRLYFL
eukprot:TRINITY_DN18532_c0_g1_i1.p1 TRINITY_DN18532_c0_g1~~TRINITY_DN18532_c0_g1_i1.p1  ORF type:complete len:188 (-),score=1.41 TRINITY_DN18532_c0_g1_i1:2-565(-)